MARSWQPRERRLVAEWVRIMFPNAHIREQVRLGAIEPALDDANISEKELRALGVTRRYVDALAVQDNTVHLIEAKILNRPGALEQLDLYEFLLPLTPELRDLRGLPIVKHLVWAIPDPVVEALARRRGIRVHEFRPEWVDAYLEILRPRETRAPRAPGELLAALRGDEEE